MMFNVDADVGVIVKGWVMPDSFDGHCTVEFLSGGRVVHTTKAEHALEVIVAPGRHVDHRCRFFADIYSCEGLDKFEDLEVRDQDTGMLIYRRQNPNHISKNVFRLETHILPLWRLDDMMNSRFQYFSSRIENFGRETVMQMFSFWHRESNYISGRVLYKSIQTYLENGYDRIFIMHHPYEELAERLLVLRQLSNATAGLLAERDINALKPVIDFASDLPLSNEREFERALRNIPPNVERALSNPITMQLTAVDPDERVGARALTMALTTLAEFEIVGLRRAPSVFIKAISEFLNIPKGDFPSLGRLPGVTELAKKLRNSRSVDRLLDLDTQIYSHIAEAYNKAGILAPSVTQPAS